MQLPGRLGVSTLGDLLGALHRTRTTGLLELCELPTAGGRTVPGRRHRIHLSLGLVVAVESAVQVPPLGELLRRGGHVPGEGVTRLLHRVAAGDDRPAGEILVSEGFVHRDVVDATLRRQLREKLDALFGIEDATVTFHIARRFARRSGPLTPTDFLHGRPRARDRGKRAATGAASKEPSDTHTSGAERRDKAARASALRVLGLTDGADAASVKRAFRRLASELHPDRCQGAPQDERARRAALFARVSAAYHSLV